MKKYFEYAVVIVIFLLTSGRQAHAYIDPGSGSIIMTAILGFLAAIAFTSRRYFYKLRNLFRRKSTAESENGTESNED